MPGVPPVSDTVAGFELLGWYGMQVNKGTPAEVIAKINTEIVRAVKTPEIAERMLATGVDPLGSSPAALLAGNNAIERDYILKEAGKQGDVEWLNASPKKQDNTFNAIRILGVNATHTFYAQPMRAV